MARQKTKGQKVSPKNLLYFITVVIIAVVAYFVGKGNISSDFFKDIFKGSDKAAVAVETTVHFIDVGQGDSEFIELPNGETLLIDAGTNETGADVVNYIESLGYSSIDYVVGTHPHEDHIGGLDDVIRTFDVESVYMPKVTADTKKLTRK